MVSLCIINCTNFNFSKVTFPFDTIFEFHPWKVHILETFSFIFRRLQKKLRGNPYYFAGKWHVSSVCVFSTSYLLFYCPGETGYGVARFMRIVNLLCLFSDLPTFYLSAVPCRDEVWIGRLFGKWLRMYGIYQYRQKQSWVIFHGKNCQFIFW